MINFVITISFPLSSLIYNFNIYLIIVAFVHVSNYHAGVRGLSIAYYKRKVRNRQIRKRFHGGNYDEQAINFELTKKQILHIVHSEGD